MTRFRIGDATVTAIPEIEDSSFQLRSFFPASTAEAVRAEADWLSPRFHDRNTDRIRLSIHAWLVDTGRRRILVDTCIGNHKHRPARQQWDSLNSPFLKRLAALDLRPEQIDYVCCTHLHADHVGWNTQLLDGRWVPTFPNAKYVFGKSEFDHWNGVYRSSDPASHHLAAYTDSVLPVIEAGQVLLAEDGFVLDECLEFRPAPGHTPGHVAIWLRSNGQSCVFSGDILHHPIQLRHPSWSCMGCEDPAEAARTRETLLDTLAGTDTHLMTGHFLAPHAGQVTGLTKGFWLSTLAPLNRHSRKDRT